MIRAPFYFATLITAIVALWLTVRVKKTRADVVAIYPVLIMTIAYAVFMAGRTIFYWCECPLCEPPTSVTLAAVANGILWAWAAAAAIIMWNRLHPNG